MRRITTAVGILLAISGFLIIFQGPGFLSPLAEALGLISYTQIQTAIIAQTLLSVPPSNHTFLSADLMQGEQVKGSLEVANGREIAFYVMTEGNFSEWREGRPSEIILAKPFATSYNFSFSTLAGGKYYFVFDNQDNARRALVFKLSVVKSVATLNPEVEYTGYGMFALGLLLLAIGVRTGKKEVEGVAVATVWRCKYCGARNRRDQIFCEKCGRSQQ